MMCMSMPCIGSPLSMIVSIRFIVSTFISSLPFSSWFLSSWVVGVSAAFSWCTKLYVVSRNVVMVICNTIELVRRVMNGLIGLSSGKTPCNSQSVLREMIAHKSYTAVTGATPFSLNHSTTSLRSFNSISKVLYDLTSYCCFSSMPIYEEETPFRLP